MRKLSNESLVYNQAYLYEPLQPVRRKVNGKTFNNLKNPPKKHKRHNKVKINKF